MKRVWNVTKEGVSYSDEESPSPRFDDSTMANIIANVEDGNEVEATASLQGYLVRQKIEQECVKTLIESIGIDGILKHFYLIFEKEFKKEDMIGKTEQELHNQLDRHLKASAIICINLIKEIEERQ